MDPFQFSLLIALGLFIIWRGTVVWRRGAKGFAIAMFALAAFVFFEAGRIYFSPPTPPPAEKPAQPIITQPAEDTAPTGLDEQPNEDHIDNNDQYMSAPPEPNAADTEN